MGIPDMKPEKPARDAASLIERASAHYGLSSSSGRRVRKPMDVPLIPEPAEAKAEAVSATAVAPSIAMTPAQPEPQPAPVSAPVRGATKAEVAEISLPRLSDLGFIVPGHPPTALSEEFRIVKRPLLLNAFGGRSTPSVDRGRAILVCSAHPNEGKTFCSINLAMSLVNERNVEVVLVDADVAKPEVLSTIGISGSAGLLDALVQDVDPESLVIPTTIPGLSVLPAGHQTPNDTELLASPEAFALVDAMLAKNPARIVIFDCAPALAASPASALAHHIGQVLLIVRADRTNESDLSEAVKLLAGQAPIQMLLNGTTFPGSSQKYGSYYGYGG